MMSIARIRHERTRLEVRYGEVGVVAGRYLEAGYHVRLFHPTRYGEVHVLAYKGDTRLVVEVVKEAATVGAEVVERVARKAELLKARPVLILYGNGPRLSEEARSRARETGVKVRRIRARRPPVAVP